MPMNQHEPIPYPDEHAPAPAAPPAGWYPGPSGAPPAYWGPAHAPVAAPQYAGPAPTHPPASKLPWIIAAISIMVALAALLALWGMRPSRQGQPGQLGQPGHSAVAMPDGEQSARQDMAFLTALEQREVPVSSVDTAKAAAEAYCQSLAGGADAVDSIRRVRDILPNLDPNEAIGLGEAAEQAYCPR